MNKQNDLYTEFQAGDMSHANIDIIAEREHDATTLAKSVTLATGLNATDDEVTARPKGVTPVALTASGQILAAPGQIVGFHVNSTSSGTIRFSDALTATTPYLGGAITPAVGYHAFPSALATGGYATIANTLDVTVFVIAD